MPPPLDDDDDDEAAEELEEEEEEGKEAEDEVEEDEEEEDEEDGAPAPIVPVTFVAMRRRLTCDDAGPSPSPSADPGAAVLLCCGGCGVCGARKREGATE